MIISQFVVLNLLKGASDAEVVAPDVGAGAPAKGRRRYVLPDGEQTTDWREAQDLYQRYLARQEISLAEQTPEEFAEATEQLEALTETSAMFRDYLPEPMSIPEPALVDDGIDFTILYRMMQDEEDAIVALLLT